MNKNKSGFSNSAIFVIPTMGALISAYFSLLQGHSSGWAIINIVTILFAVWPAFWQHQIIALILAKLTKHNISRLQIGHGMQWGQFYFGETLVSIHTWPLYSETSHRETIPYQRHRYFILAGTLSVAFVASIIFSYHGTVAKETLFFAWAPLLDFAIASVLLTVIYSGLVKRQSVANHDLSSTTLYHRLYAPFSLSRFHSFRLYNSAAHQSNTEVTFVDSDVHQHNSAFTTACYAVREGQLRHAMDLFDAISTDCHQQNLRYQSQIMNWICQIWLGYPPKFSQISPPTDSSALSSDLYALVRALTYLHNDNPTRAMREIDTIKARELPPIIRSFYHCAKAAVYASLNESWHQDIHLQLAEQNAATPAQIKLTKELITNLSNRRK